MYFVVSAANLDVSVWLNGREILANTAVNWVADSAPRLISLSGSLGLVLSISTEISDPLLFTTLL